MFIFFNDICHFHVYIFNDIYHLYISSRVKLVFAVSEVCQALVKREKWVQEDCQVLDREVEEVEKKERREKWYVYALDILNRYYSLFMICSFLVI